jgi:hypothetical protein
MDERLAAAKRRTLRTCPRINLLARNQDSRDRLMRPRGMFLIKETPMTFKSLISPLAVAGILAFSAAPAFAAVYVPEHLVIREHHQTVNLSSLTPAERTVLEDQCRQKQADAANSTSGDDLGNANPEVCNAIGLPVA